MNAFISCCKQYKSMIEEGIDFNETALFLCGENLL